MEKKIIIGLTGKIASGKGAIKKYLIENYQAVDYRFSTPLRDILQRLSLPESRENMQALSTNIRLAFGETCLSFAIFKDLEKNQAAITVSDGIRRLGDIENLRELPNFTLIAIEVEQPLRYQRALLRNENPGDDQKTMEDFIVDESREAEQQIPEVMGHADYTIDNNGTFDEMYRQVDAILKELRSTI